MLIYKILSEFKAIFLPLIHELKSIYCNSRDIMISLVHSWQYFSATIHESKSTYCNSGNIM